jgi:hypothetical protein
MALDRLPGHERRTVLMVATFIVAMAALFAALVISLARTMSAY